MTGERLDPLFFGDPRRRLYGCHHGPLAGTQRDLGVVIAPPFGHEYIRSHRALRQLASRLAQERFRALRFDFFGCGDSAGDAWPDSLEPWLADLDAAVREVKLRARCPRIAIVGLRLGATLALESALAKGGIEALVLWEPVLDGKAATARWRELEATFQRNVGRATAASADGALECLGVRWPRGLVASVETLDLNGAGKAGTKPPARVVLLETAPVAASDALAKSLAERGAEIRREPYTGSQFWSEDVDKALVPSPALDAIVARLVEIAR